MFEERSPPLFNGKSTPLLLNPSQIGHCSSLSLSTRIYPGLQLLGLGGQITFCIWQTRSPRSNSLFSWAPTSKRAFLSFAQTPRILLETIKTSYN
jgi:hypothetical protein